MSGSDRRIKQSLQRLLLFIVPKGMTAKERTSLANSAGISVETLRTTVKRQSLNADTLIRLLIARGVSAQTIENLPQTELVHLSQGEIEWMELGRELSEGEKKEFSGLVRFLLIKWQLKIR
ncbi:MAG: hypothetical protein ACXVBQ_14535 [Pseudobdellovibrionaceae bacterium]